MIKSSGQRRATTFAGLFLFCSIFIPYYCYYRTNTISASTSETTAKVFYFPYITKTTPARPSVNANYFPYGVFEDSTVMGGSDAIFRAKIRSLKDGKYGIKGTFDSILFTNGPSIAEEHLLNVADQEGFTIIAAPMNELNQYVWKANPQPSAAQIDSVVSSYVNAYKKHPSVIAYNTLDDANSQFNWGLPTVISSFQTHDPANPASGLFISTSIGKEAILAADPKVILLQEYPAGYGQPACDFTYFNSRHTDFSTMLKYMLMEKPKDVPVYISLQTHNTIKYDFNDPVQVAAAFNNQNILGGLREPTVEELRLQQWLAVGEGVKGIYWFTYSKTPYQEWRGIENTDFMYQEIADLSNRIQPLKSTLLQLEKTDDFVDVSGTGKTYISTLRHKTTGEYYIVAANHECTPQTLRIDSRYVTGQIRDLETNKIYNLGDSFSFRGGDGKMFQLLITGQKQAPVPAQNLAVNSSFEQGNTTNTFPAGWAERTSATITESKVTWVDNFDRLLSAERKSSLRIDGPNLTDRENIISQNVQLQPNKTYTVSFYAKRNVLKGRGVGLRYLMTNPKDDIALIQYEVGGTTDWQRNYLSFTTPSTYQQGRLDIWWDLADGDSVWIDDVAICEGRSQCDDGNTILPVIPNSTSP